MRMKLTHKEVEPVLRITYPEYRGRKFSLERKEKYHLQNYWDGGSRNYVVAVMCREGKLVSTSADYFNPITDSRAHGSFEIPRNVVLVEHCIFCGKDLGITLIFHPESELLPKFLPQTI